MANEMRCGRCGHGLMKTKADGWVSASPVNDSETGALLSIETSPNCDVDGYRHGPIVPVLPQSK